MSSNSPNRQNQTSTSFKEPPRTGSGDDKLRCSSYSSYTIDELKNRIRALLISQAGGAMSVTQLNKHFKLLNGEEVPYRRFGFQQLDEMLRSMPDIVQLNGHGPSACVLPANVQQILPVGKSRRKQNSNNSFDKTRTSYDANCGPDNSFNRPANNYYSMPFRNLGAPSAGGNAYPTAYEQFVMDAIANYAQRYWY
ncbi:uncharacterized protein LOC131285267 [Anopheles ziemanni]|nr:uncharacterized protein LOC131285267 [Anopheles ziemanni]